MSIRFSYTTGGAEVSFPTGDTMTVLGSVHANGSLTAAGEVVASGQVRGASIRSLSDRRLKRDLAPVCIEDEKWEKIRAYRYRFCFEKDGAQKHVGLLAQEVAEVLPEAVTADAEGTLSLDYNAVVAVLVDRLHRLEAEVRRLRRDATGKDGGSAA